MTHRVICFLPVSRSCCSWPENMSRMKDHLLPMVLWTLKMRYKDLLKTSLAPCNIHKDIKFLSLYVLDNLCWFTKTFNAENYFIRISYIFHLIVASQYVRVQKKLSVDFFLNSIINLNNFIVGQTSHILSQIL